MYEGHTWQSIGHHTLYTTENSSTPLDILAHFLPPYDFPFVITQKQAICILVHEFGVHQFVQPKIVNGIREHRCPTCKKLSVKNFGFYNLL